MSTSAPTKEILKLLDDYTIALENRNIDNFFQLHHQEELIQHL